MKVLLLFPNAANWATVCTAIPILSGIAQKHKWSVDYFDTYAYEKTRDSTTDKETTGGFKPGFSKEETKQLPHENIIPDLQSKIDKLNPDLLAISCLSQEYEFLTSFLPKINLPGHTKAVIGGIHASLMADDVIKTKMFDLVVIYEGEATFGEILTRMENEDSLRDIQGTYFMDRSTGEIIKNPRRQLLSPEELWAVEADFSFYDDAYFLRPFDGKMIRRYDVDMARGCPYNCNYCGNSALKRLNKGLGMFMKTRPFDSLFSHLKNMLDKYDIDIFQLMDECFLAHPNSWLEEFGERYAAECGKPFIVQTRAETVTEERIKILKSFGAPFQISIGVESGSERILRDICKRTCTKQHIIKAFDILQKYHIRTNAFFMLGLPYETREDIFNTIDLCRRIKPSVSSISIFQPLPGQELTRLCIEKGFITGKEPMATFTSGSLLKMPPPYLSKEEITNLRKTFALYTSLPKEYYPQIEKCEKDYESNKKLFDDLVDLRWKSYDYSATREEIKMV